MANLSADLDDRLRALERELEQLAADRQRYADLFALAPEAALVTDLNGTILEGNRAAETLLEKRSLRGEPIDEYVPMEQRRMFRARVECVLAAGRPSRFPGAVRLRRGDVAVEFSLRALGEARLAWLIRPLH